MKKTIVLLFLTCISLQMKAQQETEISLYFLNGLLVNPGYAGSKGALSVNAWYRHQWVNMPGAPRTATVSIHSPLKNNKLALGLMYTNDRFGLNNKNSLYGTFAYKIPIKNETRLSFGVQAGFDNWNSSLTEAILPDLKSLDPKFSANINAFLPNFGFGMYLYKPNRYYLGASIPHIVPFALSSTLDATTKDNLARLYTHLTFTGGYTIGKEFAMFKFIPSFLLTYAERAPVNANLTLSALYNDRFMLGISYELGSIEVGNRSESIIGHLKFAVNNNLEIGYSYDRSLNRLGQFNNGSHEFFVGYTLTPDSKRFVTPRFISYF